MNSVVVVVPGTVMCPTCSFVLHPVMGIVGNQPVPEHIEVRCMNGRCPERLVVKRMPLQRVNVEVLTHEHG